MTGAVSVTAWHVRITLEALKPEVARPHGVRSIDSNYRETARWQIDAYLLTVLR